MSHLIPEATPENLPTIKAMVFLAETRQELEKAHGVRNFKLQFKSEQSAGRGVADSHYVELLRDGELVTQAYVHPTHGNPATLAYLLFVTQKPVTITGGR